MGALKIRSFSTGCISELAWMAVTWRFHSREYYNLNTWGDFNRAWFHAAEELGSQALCRVTDAGRRRPVAISARCCSCRLPAWRALPLMARLINRMGLSPNIRRMPIFGLGCVGGAAGISRARRLRSRLSGPGRCSGECRDLFTDFAAR